MMRNEESAKALAEALSNEEAVQDAQPLTLEDMKHATAEPVAEDEGGFHGGDTVWSKKHGENRHILMAHRMEIDGRSFVQRYTFTDGTGATAQEVEAAHEDERAPVGEKDGTAITPNGRHAKTISTRLRERNRRQLMKDV